MNKEFKLSLKKLNYVVLKKIAEQRGYRVGGSRDTVEIGSQDSPSDLKLYKESSTDRAGITYNSETGETRFDGNIGVHGDNDAAAVIGEGIDVHGSVRVTETLSAKNLIVDYITVQEDSFGNIGGGGTGGGSELAPVSGVATAGGT